jgi:hypothetical protein
MSDNSTIQLIADEALRELLRRMQAYDAITDVKALEAMRAIAVDVEEQRTLDLVILTRKREAKALFEVLDRRADLFDKSALPAAAALPGFVAFLDSQHVFDGSHRAGVLTFSYLFGGAVWIICRWLSFKYGGTAKRRLAELGKVD